jgi:2-polyprenyl-3-methyl-5-hydroxy-6-metoxy-1,4-benzoquinol methylase
MDKIGSLLTVRFQSKKEAQDLHINNYRSDGVLKQYGEPYQSHYFRVRYVIDQIEENSKVLDVGCNGGSLGIHLLKKGCHVNGIDLVDELVEKAKRRGIFAEKGEAENLSRYDSKSFKYVICTEVLEHLYDPFPAVKEAYRVLKEGGKYIITVPHPNGRMGGEKLGDYHQQNFTLEILNTLIYSCFKKGDAKIIEIPYTDQFNLSEGISPIGTDKNGNNLYPPQWVGITAEKKVE